MRACHSFGRGVVVGWEGEPHHPLHPAQPTHRSPAPLSLLLPPFPAVWLFATTWCHVLGLTPPRMHKLQDALPPLPPSKKNQRGSLAFLCSAGVGGGVQAVGGVGFAYLPTLPHAECGPPTHITKDLRANCGKSAYDHSAWISASVQAKRNAY